MLRVVSYFILAFSLNCSAVSSTIVELLLLNCKALYPKACKFTDSTDHTAYCTYHILCTMFAVHKHTKHIIILLTYTMPLDPSVMNGLQVSEK